MIARLSRKAMSLPLARMSQGTLTIVERGSRRTFGPGHGPSATIEVRSARFWPKLLRGSRGLGDAFELGMWDSPDVVALVRLAARNARALDRVRERMSWLLAPLRLARALAPRRTRARRRRDVQAHYDLGNDLFERMLDSTLSYSCAYFESPRMTLEEAQLAKLDRVCRALELRPGDHVVEIGSGWGGFAVHAASNYGCRVTTATVSAAQHRYATDLVRRKGLEQRVHVVMSDFADLRGTYDKLVSVEMIEAIGWRNFDRFFATCARLLAPEGAMLLQAITIEDPAYEVEKRTRTFANTRIFPGGCLPSLRAIRESVARVTDLRPIKIDDLTPHYVETLRCWRSKLTAHAHELERLGYGARFRRLWTLYLAYCEAGFAERRIGDIQLLLAKPRWRGGTEISSADSSRALGQVA